MVQVIVCKCGAAFAACTVPECYTETSWLRDIKKYVEKGCTVKMVDNPGINFEACKCDKQRKLEFK